MDSEPRMIVLTGLVFGAVTIGAYVSQLDNDWSSGQNASLTADAERGVSATGAVAEPSDDRTHEAASAQAMRRRALRDDVAALRAQSNLSIGAQAGDALAIAALQYARVTNEQQTSQPLLTNPWQPTNAPLQSAPNSSLPQTSPATNPQHAPHGRGVHGEHPRGVSGGTKKPRSAQGAATTSGTSHARGGSHRSSSTGERSAKKAASVAPEAWPGSQGVDSPASVSRAEAASQAEPESIASDAPRTRAEVRAELERARENGTFPAFGNPEPMGPRP
ncbi:DUF4148 domain-containing protein [Paraburkholderia sp. MMS20-SJTN17]|uniref:DUF4148 domain-containing protein n=1 Tax=Paraburkholderia translucens TaxID=2886945 RepID=A0ABS8K6L7_9BURK|nr:DUF4148 domain-containing protein [Paraburkholderia sp. MMS20-SJTN17]MCC8400372.1 DUF4148 domain-containing protein [Paraburkholderia sp. MMS20-SJTN17]